MSLGISTVYVSQLEGAEAMVRALAAFGVDGVEIEYRIKAGDLKALIPLLKQAGLSVVSLHHPVPLPDRLPPEAASGDRLALASPERTEREAGLAAARRSLELASDLEAAAVVFHLGAVAELEPLWGELARHFEEKMVDSDEAAKLRAEAVDRRRELAAPYLDRALLALDRLAPAAERLGVRIAIENRYHFHEVPSANEIATILEAFRGAPIGYWHDVGHAAAQERVGFATQEALLERFKGELVGVHLHDARGLEDHLPPGAGTVEFARLAPLLAAAPLKVLELKPGAAREQVEEGTALLREAGILG